MDINDIGSLIGSLRSVVGLIKDAGGMFPKERNTTEEINRLICDVEEKAACFEADMAVKLGYQICRSHFPPVIMLEGKRYIFRCPECGKDIDTTPTIMTGRTKTTSSKVNW